MCFFGTKAFSISAIITAKIVYSGFLASRASGVAPIMQISKVLDLFGSSIVSYLGLGLGLVSDTELVLELGLGSLSILFIVGYQSF